MARRTLVTALVGAALLVGCQPTTVRPDASPTRLLEFSTGVLPTGAYHGVTLFFEVDLRSDGSGRHLESGDLPGVADWIDADRMRSEEYHRQLPPVTPGLRRDGSEVYRIGTLPVVEYRNSMWETGGYRYLRQDKARLYVFKSRKDFSFRFRGQEVVVPSKDPWTPSLYYYPEEEVREGRHRRLVREVVQVGLATIEAMVEEGRWEVNGKAFFPSGERILVLQGAIHAQGSVMETGEPRADDRPDRGAGPPGEAAEAARAAPVEVLGLSAAEFASECGRVLAAAGQPPYRAGQIRDWIYRRTPGDFGDMSDLPRPLRREIEQVWSLHPLDLARSELSRDGTRKFLWARPGGGAIESVAIPDRGRTTYCISTQAGCPVRCTFCATGHGGFVGQLRPAEIVDQVLSMRRITEGEPTNIVYMGMGEPLLNYEAVKRSIEVLTSTDQVGLGSRRITVSTVGMPDRIRELARDFPQVKLALSLHAPSDELRSELIPFNRQFPLARVLDAVRDHARITGKKPTFEYVVLPEVNDGEEQAREVARVLRGIPSRINLIGFNPFPGAAYEKPTVLRLLRFREWLGREFPGEITIRRSRGEDIHGACGQLNALERMKAP